MSEPLTGLDLGGPIPTSWPWGEEYPPRDVGFLTLARRADGRVVRALSLGLNPALRNVHAVRADGRPAVVVPVRLVALDGSDVTGDGLPPVPDDVALRPVSPKALARRRRRLDGLVALDDAPATPDPLRLLAEVDLDVVELADRMFARHNRADVEKARRTLETLVRVGLVEVAEQGERGGRPTLYRLAWAGRRHLGLDGPDVVELDGDEDLDEEGNP